MDAKQYDIIGFENPFQDMIVELDRLPQNNQRAYMHSMSFQGGGNVSTAVAAASVLGADCAMLGVVGDDMFGNSVLADFELNGVDTGHVRKDAGKRTNFGICVSEREINGKEFIIKRGDVGEIGADELDSAFLKSAKILHVGGLLTPAMLKAADIVRGAGGKVSVDAAYYRPDIFKNLNKYDIFIASETYYLAMCADIGDMSAEAAAHWIYQRGPEVVIITLGERGCRGVSARGYFELPAFAVELADSTGAGDVFHGAYDFAYLKGWDSVRCARFASAVSAIKCTRMGGRAGIPDYNVVMRFLDMGEIDYARIDARVAHYSRGLLC